MMTKGKRWMACVLAAILLMTTAAGCGKTDSGGSSSPEGSAGSETPAASAGEQGTEAQTQDLSSIRGNAAPTQEEIDLVNGTLDDSYLGDDLEVFADIKLGSDYSAYPYQEDTTLTVWMAQGITQITVYPDYNDHPVFKHIEELTGIDLEIISPTLGEESTEFNLMLTDGELPDIIIGSYYPGGAVAGIEDGVYVDNMAELIDQYMPNYKIVRESNESYAKDTTLDDGSIGCIYGAHGYPGLDWYCLMIKQDALDKTGLPAPETMDEWHDFLVACKDAGYTYPLVMDDFYGSYFTSVFSSPYGSYDWLYLNEEGKVAFGPGQEGTKEYLQVMQDWYKEGLINNDLVTGSREEHISYMVSEDSAAALLWMDYYDNDGIEYVVVDNPVLNKGDTPICTSSVSYIGSPAFITTSCKNVEAACAFLDFGFSKKGWEMYNFGSYGDVHLVDADGMPYYPESSLMYNDPDNMPYDTLKLKYRLHSFPNFNDDEHSNPATTSNDHVLNNRIYMTTTQDHSLSMPKVTLTPEEAERANAIGTNISTSRKEYFTKIVMGQLPVDAWDDFMKDAKDMGLEEWLSIQQTALDRYNAR